MEFSNASKRGVALALSLVVPISVWAGEWGGTVAASSGVVKINGQPIRGSHPLLSGDSLQTSAGSAIVRLPNATVAVSQNSHIRFDGSVLIVQGGFAEISGNKGFRTLYRDVSIHAAGPDAATFAVGELEGKPTVATLKGAVVVSNASGSVVLPAGRAMEARSEEESLEAEPIPLPQGQQGQAAEPAVKGGHGPREDSERGGKRNRRMLGGWWETGIIAGLIGGTLGTLAALGYFSSAPISTASPSGGRGTVP